MNNLSLVEVSSNRASGRHLAGFVEFICIALCFEVASISNLREDLQPACWGGRRSWRMASASAPNKKQEKPDARRPIVDRSCWPTARLDSAVGRVLDWVSGHFLPAHMHIDIQRVDAVLPLLQQFNEDPLSGVPEQNGADRR